jgi:hypothetical protein
MGKTLSKPRLRYATARPPAPPPLQPTDPALARYRSLAPDRSAGVPWRQHGEVGSYWTVPTRVPLSELTGLTAIVFNIGRLHRVRRARQDGVPLPPIRLGVKYSGRIWIIDGNHRVTEARESGQHDIEAVFTFAGT